MGRRDRLRARQLPTESVPLVDPQGGPDEVIELRAIPPDEWETLLGLHPPTEAQAEQGHTYNGATFRPALLERCVITPEGEEPLTAADWAELAAGTHLAPGEFIRVYNAAYSLNDRSPSTVAGKG